MKRDIKSLLSVSLAAMDQPSSSMLVPMDVSLDVRLDDGIVNDVEDDSIPSMDGIPSKSFSWSEDTNQGLFFPCFSRTVSHRPPILFLSRGTRLCYRSAT